MTIHAAYTRDEIWVGLGYWSRERRPDQREGVLHISESKVNAFFVTRQKTEEIYSPTTRYEDYLITHDQLLSPVENGGAFRVKMVARVLRGCKGWAPGGPGNEIGWVCDQA